jgi:hypothetical protein
MSGPKLLTPDQEILVFVFPLYASYRMFSVLHEVKVMDCCRSLLMIRAAMLIARRRKDRERKA